MPAYFADIPTFSRYRMLAGNTIKYALKAFSFDVESFVIKCYNSFLSSAKRSDGLWEFYEFLQMENRELLWHVPTWWLSLIPAIDRLLLCWPALKSYFASQGEDGVADLILRGFSCGEDDLSVIPEYADRWVKSLLVYNQNTQRCFVLSPTYCLFQYQMPTVRESSA